MPLDFKREKPEFGSLLQSGNTAVGAGEEVNCSFSEHFQSLSRNVRWEPKALKLMA